MTDVTFFVHDDPSLSLIKAELLLISNQNEKMILNFQNGYIYPDINSANKNPIISDIKVAYATPSIPIPN